VPVTVLLVDDVPELRAVLRQRLRLRGGFEVVADVGDGASAVTAATLHQPDLVVLDLGLPDLAGQEVLTGVRAAAPGAQIVVYTGSVSRENFALTHEVDGYVPKDQDVTYLVELLVQLTARGRQAASLRLGPHTADVALARGFLVAHCERWGCVDLLDDAQLVVTELVTNALVHGGSHCDLAIVYRDRWLRIEIQDFGSGGPDLQAVDVESEGGRGLLIVSAMTESWGVQPLPAEGKVIWAELRSTIRPPETASRGAAALGETTPPTIPPDADPSEGTGEPGAHAAVERFPGPPRREVAAAGQRARRPACARRAFPRPAGTGGPAGPLRPGRRTSNF
jgi:CheY-like chemotaxis protein